MAKVTGPLFSMSASGSVGKAITFGTWKGIPWVRVWFSPANPQTAKQVNIRAALSLLVVSWQAETAGPIAAWNAFAEGTGMSGYNQYMSRGLDEYIVQITIDVTPVSVSVLGDPPADVWTWT